MDSKNPNRRRFLKGGAAAAGLAAGAVQSASGQTPPSEAPTPKRNIKEQIAYGERSRFVTSIREPAIIGTPSSLPALATPTTQALFW